MPAERTTMRQVREILRLKFVGGVPSREIARCVGVAASTVRVTIKRFQAAGLVAVLGASNFTYAEATWTQGLSDWIGAHTRAFAAIGAVPRLLVKPACTNRRSTEPMRRWRRITAVSAIIFAPSRGHAGGWKPPGPVHQAATGGWSQGQLDTQ